MPTLRLDREQVRQAAELMLRGRSIAEIANSWGVNRSALYKAFDRYDIPRPEVPKLDAMDHLALQAESGTPPEIYAYRAGLKLATVRRYAWDYGQPLTCNTYAERKAWWERRLETFDPHHVKAFTQCENVPLLELAQWYHRINRPMQLMLWGFNELLYVEAPQFEDISRFADTASDLFALGRGRDCVPISTRIATEVFNFASKYQHH